MRVRVLAALVYALMTAGVAAAQNSRAEILFAQEMKKKCSDVKSIRCRFVQTRSSSVLVHDVQKRGTYSFLQPYNVLLAFDDGDYIKITSAMFEIKQNGHTTATKAGSNPMLRNLNRILSACISGDAAQITSGFDTEITASDDEFTVRLLPMRGRTNKKSPQTLLVFARKDMSLRSMSIEQASGDMLRYEFHDVKYNADIDAAMFDIQ